MIHLTLHARSALSADEALVFDWHRVAICCATAGEVSLRPAAREHDCRRMLGVRRFRSDLPPDFGLRSVFRRAETSQGRQDS